MVKFRRPAHCYRPLPCTRGPSLLVNRSNSQAVKKLELTHRQLYPRPNE